MKGRLNSTIIALVVINVLATFVVFVLAYEAGAKSGGRALFEIGALPSDALYRLLGAVGVLVIGSLLVLFHLSNKVSVPVKALADFSDEVSAGDFARVWRRAARTTLAILRCA